MKAVMNENVLDALQDAEGRVSLRHALKNLVTKELDNKELDGKQLDTVQSAGSEAFNVGTRRVYLTFVRPSKSKK